MLKAGKFFGMILFSLCTLLFFENAKAQSNRNYIKEQIQLQNNCRNVTITKSNGDVMLYGRNGWAAYGCPSGLTTVLSELNRNNEYIDDVQLTEDGSWIILYGNNGFRWYDIPYSLEQKLKYYNSNNEIVTSVTFNDAGNWIIISTKYYSASDPEILEWLQEGVRKYGQLWAACITNDACVAVYEEGYRFIGDIPQDLINALNSTSKDIYRIKVAGSSWFIADKNGWFHYCM